MINSIIGHLRAFYRTLLFLCILTCYLIASLWIHLTVKEDMKRRPRFSSNASFYTNLCCRFFGIRTRVINAPPKKADGLFVGNHIGFIDIMAVNSILPCLFVTSKEMHETPVLGLITEFAGCIYTDRKKRGNILDELGEMVSYLKEGFRVVLYPEATSHNGEEILPFKRTLMSAAAHAGVPIRPYVFNFVNIQGEPFNLKWRDKVCWYGDMTFYDSLWRAFTVKYIVAEIEFLKPIYPQVNDNRKFIAESIRQSIVDRFRPVSTI